MREHAAKSRTQLKSFVTLSRGKNEAGSEINKMAYIVLDVPSPVADHVLALRHRFRSWRVALPVEITLAGSSGIGVLRYEESETASTFQTINEVARQFRPIMARFISVARLPNTGIFYYQQSDPDPFIQLQRALIETGLTFDTSPFPFTPHCTIVDFKEPGEKVTTEMLSIPAPDTDIVLDTLSIYTLDERILSGNREGCRLLHRTKLVGAT